MDDVIISVDNVSKNFRLPQEKSGTLKSAFTNILKIRNRTIKTQHALHDVSFEIKRGEFFGIVGRNGSGKSTLLKMLAGIYQPTQGKIKVRGKLVPFIELGVGFNPELTGRQNVYLNGALLGFSEKEIDQQYDDIVDFAELKPFMDQKLKNYSSGMQVRLAFSMAVRAKADVLLIDEVLAVGDADFQRKCFEYFKRLKGSHTTVVFVSHDMNAVRQFCDRAVLINDGKVEISGNTDKVAQAYTELFAGSTNSGQSSGVKSKRWGEAANIIHNPNVTVTKKTITITGELKSDKAYPSPIFGYLVRNTQAVNLVGCNSQILKVGLKDVSQKGRKFVIEFSNFLSDGEYELDLALLKDDGVSVLDWWENAAKFKVKKDYLSAYVTSPETNLTFIEGK